MKQKRLSSIRTILAAMAIGLSAVLIGCGGGGGGGGDGTSPMIANTITIVGEDFSFDGGPVGIAADVTDPSGVGEVCASVTRPDGSLDPTPVTMTLTSGDTYTGTYSAVANTREDGQAETYSVTVTATDNAGNSGTSSAFQFPVPAPELPGNEQPF